MSIFPRVSPEAHHKRDLGVEAGLNRFLPDLIDEDDVGPERLVGEQVHTLDHLPGEELRIKSLGAKSGLAPSGIAAVSLLRVIENLQWAQADDALTVKIPNRQMSENPVTFKIILNT